MRIITAYYYYHNIELLITCALITYVRMYVDVVRVYILLNSYLVKLVVLRVL